ncbi:S1C family serine protease [Nocardioides luteus]|uniref:S1C family serine protease n=1 Tax=Nocardioides luteus TaxID=1844 RepID=UPI001A2A1477|nr:trypsin-like peptidase domain-containing protein [Nocardioides luteus]MBG6094746.1 putative serine protease PepD [Nocardioides luteus]
MTELPPQQPSGTPPQWTPPAPPAGSTQPPAGPFAAPPAQTSVMPAVPGAPGTPGTPTKKRAIGRTGLVAAVLAGALVAGGTAGVGGAAIYDALAGDGSSGGAHTPATSQVVDAKAPEGSIEKVSAKVLPSVVKIEVTSQQGSGSGSGVVISSDGTILTNNHVVELAANGGTVTVDFNDGTKASAEVLGTDPLTDTAVIKAKGVSGLTPITIGKSANLTVGQSVVAIGSPFGLDSTVTTGIVSALDRPVNVGVDQNGAATVYPAVQTDAAINPGNSGGALVDLNGNLVGINASIRSGGGASSEDAGSIGIGFAIPIDEIYPIVEQLEKGEQATHAQFGISVSDAPEAQNGQTSVTGALVQEVTQGSTAQKAGLEKGDVITKVDDHVITGSDSLVATVRSYRPNDEVEVTWSRNGDVHTEKVTLDSDAS